jgi:hypothetical protein
MNRTPFPGQVWLGSKRVGETPISSLSGPSAHESFPHPQFGEKRHAISVTMSGPTRVSVDMR